jgi:hypothetical protein
MEVQQSEGANYYWKWSYNASGLIVWLALILATVLPKANRNPRTLLIFVPLVIVNLLWLVVKASGIVSSDASEFSTVFHSIAVGITILWLIVNYFNRFRGWARFLISFITIVVVSYLGTLSYSTGFPTELILIPILCASMAITMLSAMTIAGKLCQWKYRPLNFMLWLALWTPLVSLVTTFVFYIVGFAIMSSGSGPYILQMILMVSIVGLIFGLCLYVMNLPFMILGFTNPFFRERFCSCLRLKSIPTNATQLNANPSNDKQDHEQNNPKETGPT